MVCKKNARGIPNREKVVGIVFINAGNNQFKKDILIGGGGGFSMKGRNMVGKGDPGGRKGVSLARVSW